MLPCYQPDAANGTRELQIVGSDHSVYAYESGLFKPFHELGRDVKNGEVAGAIHHPEEPWREPTLVHFRHNGMILCKRFQGREERGDCLFQIGSDPSQ